VEVDSDLVNQFITPDTLSTLHLLASGKGYYEMVLFFFENRDSDFVPYSLFKKEFSFESAGVTGHYLRHLLRESLIEKVESSITEDLLGYKITIKGIKMSEMIKQLQLEIQNEK